jgi:thymidylate synthase
MIPCRSNDFHFIVQEIRKNLIEAPIVDVGEWQAKVGAAEGRTIEVEDVAFEFSIPGDRGQLAELVKPNLPWAEDHLLERVSGKPLNPPPSNEWWPFNVRGNASHKTGQVFSHTYPERMWPKYANVDDESGIHRGIRYYYGDLEDLIELFDKRPDTRQGYLPIWFPEDTGAHHGERVPCTLGYHMMQRGDQLTIRYYLRSCDFVRHFRDDVYMAARLCQWVCERVVHDWRPGRLVMYISSLHAFERDRRKLQEEHNDELSSQILSGLL